MRLILSCISAALLMVPGVAFGANLSALPSSIALKTGDSVSFTLKIKSSADINTIGTTVLLPSGLTFLSASDGDTIQQWVEHLTYHRESNSVSFSGIIPGGWNGEGVLAIIKVAALKDGTYSLTFDPTETEIYKNDGNATPEPVVFGSASTPFWTPQLLLDLAIALAVIVILVTLFRRKYKILFV